GTIAGCMVIDGVVRRNASVRVIRDGAVIYTTTIAQLKRFKDDVREVAEGFECGILLDGFNDVKEGDVLEIFETGEVARWSLDEAPSSSGDYSLVNLPSRAALAPRAPAFRLPWREREAGFRAGRGYSELRAGKRAPRARSRSHRASLPRRRRGGHHAREAAPQCRADPCGPRLRALFPNHRRPNPKPRSR